ncbi:hypothetical protein, partial [Pseudomonas fulva]|uniref:hypothetical protein n=1 Tax=Pseudomonas fulva TaxID=47880 RepID=UPI001C6148E5
LMSKAGQLRITPENHTQFASLLPPPLRALFRGEHVLLRSLAVALPGLAGPAQSFHQYRAPGGPGP